MVKYFMCYFKFDIKGDLMDKKTLVVIGGPTATGKTKSSVKLAKEINGEIISADSIQVYKYMDIGSAKVTNDEMDGVRHYLVDEIYPDEDFSIAVFKEKANLYINKIYDKCKIPILVGGTGFYIQSVIRDVDFVENKIDFEYRKKLLDLVQLHGNSYIHDMLKKIDEESAKKIHPNNVKRVIRALEYFKLTNEPISYHNNIQKSKETKYDVKYFVLNMDRELLYKRINMRVDLMIQKGLVNEVRKLLNMGYKRDLVSMQGIGYKEIVSYLNGDFTLEEAILRIKIGTRKFAKRQLTWFKNQTDSIWINVDDLNFDVDRIINKMKEYM